MHIAAEAVEFGDDHRTFDAPSLCQGRCKLRAAVNRIRAFAGLNLDELVDQFNAFALGETGYYIPLGFKPQT
jgi:hypothetical protein